MLQTSQLMANHSQPTIQTWPTSNQSMLPQCTTMDSQVMATWPQDMDNSQLCSTHQLHKWLILTKQAMFPQPTQMLHLLQLTE